MFDHGTISWFNQVKGYGFLTRDDGVDVFLHARSLPLGVVPQQGDRCRFVTETQSDGRLRAQGAMVVERAD
jgi:cold shock CspA family protein